MSEPACGLEAALCAAYREEAELYAKALACCRHEASAEQPATGADLWLPHVVAILAQVTPIEHRIATVKEQWQRQGRPTGAELRSCLARVAELLGPLAATVNRTVEVLEADRLKMVPQIEQIARLRRMQQAYNRAGRVSQR
jgi:hypothetical protein